MNLIEILKVSPYSEIAYLTNVFYSIFAVVRDLMSGTIFFQLILGGAFMAMCNFGFELV